MRTLAADKSHSNQKRASKLTIASCLFYSDSSGNGTFGLALFAAVAINMNQGNSTRHEHEQPNHTCG
jgi:hypothetical protein